MLTDKYIQMSVCQKKRLTIRSFGVLTTRFLFRKKFVPKTNSDLSHMHVHNDVFVVVVSCVVEVAFTFGCASLATGAVVITMVITTAASTPVSSTAAAIDGI